MSKAAVRAIKTFQALAGTGFRGRLTAGFLSGVLKLIRLRAKVIDDNLKIGYPDSSEQWRKNIRGKVYENLAWTVTELLALQRDPKMAKTWVKKVHNLDLVNELLDNHKGAILMSGHFGNWELMAAWYSQYSRERGGKVSIVVKEQSDKDVARYIDDMRSNFGVECISKDASVLKFAHMLKAGEQIALLNDIAGVGEIMVPFMGHDATNVGGPAVMSMLSGAPIVPVAIYRTAPFEHEMEFFEPVKVDSPSPNHEEHMKQIILACNEAIEHFIRKQPELWLWLHKRWRP